MNIPTDYPDISSHRRMQREAKTVAAMIDIYCSDRHGTAKRELCDACRELQDYSMLRLSKCPFQEGKTTCGNCRVHCYKPDRREQAKDMMRAAGPSMAYRHPLMVLRHFFDGFRQEPVVTNKKPS